MTLRFTNISIREVKIPLRFSYGHASNTHRECHHLIVELTADNGMVGYGEVAVRPYVTGETIEGARNDIENIFWDELKTLELTEQLPFDTLRPIYLEADSRRKTGAYAGVDIAVFDLWARSFGITASNMFGRSSGRSIDWTAPIGFGRHFLSQVFIFKLLGFSQYKIKTGSDNDLDRIRKARNLLGRRADIRVDSNGAWDETKAIEMIKGLESYNISSVEQPVDTIESLARVREKTRIPIMADESLCTTSDAKSIIAANAADIWNIRLAKVGGFSGARELIQMAKKAGVDTQLGVLVGETSVLSNAARALTSMADFKHHEYGFPNFLLKGNPFSNEIGIRGSNKKTGLGVQPKSRLLERYTVS